MELVFETQQERYLRPMLAEEIAQEETAEVLIPESSPDLARVLCCYATPIVRSKTCRDGGVSVTGGVRTDVLYLDGEQNVHRMETYLPFTARLDREGVREDSTVQVTCRCAGVDARQVNARKLMVRTGVRTGVCAYQNVEESFPRLQQTHPSLQVKPRVIPVVLPVAAGERPFTIRDTLDLPAGRPAIAKLLSCQYQLAVTDARMAGNKAVFKGTAEAHALYLDEKGEVCVFTGQLPWSQYMELEQEGAEDGLQVRLLLTDAECELTGGGLDVSLGVTAQCTAMARRELTVTEDAYSTQYALTPAWSETTLVSRLDVQTLRGAVRGELAGSFDGAVDVTAYFDTPRLRREGETVEITAPMQANVLYFDKEHGLYGKLVRMEASAQTLLADNASCTASLASDGAFYAAPAGEGAEIRGAAVFTVTSTAQMPVRMVTDGTVGDALEAGHDRPSVILRAARDGEDLWSIAKACHTTPAVIRDANLLTSGEIEAGQMLLIPAAYPAADGHKVERN